MEKIILIGGGGHCKSVIEVIEHSALFEIEGILDVREKKGEKVSGYKVIGTNEDIPELVNSFKNFHITIGMVKPGPVRARIYEMVKSNGGFLPPIISKNAYVSRHAEVGEGSIIMHGAFLNSGSLIGTNCIINTGAIIEHDAVIENNCHISTGAFINGGVVVGSNSFIGSQATLIEYITIGHANLIAAGAVVIENTLPESMYAGNPAILKKSSS